MLVDVFSGRDLPIKMHRLDFAAMGECYTSRRRTTICKDPKSKARRLRKRSGSILSVLDDSLDMMK